MQAIEFPTANFPTSVVSLVLRERQGRTNTALPPPQGLQACVSQGCRILGARIHPHLPRFAAGADGGGDRDDLREPRAPGDEGRPHRRSLRRGYQLADADTRTAEDTNGRRHIQPVSHPLLFFMFFNF